MHGWTIAGVLAAPLLAGAASATPVATLAIADGVAAYAASASGESVTLSGSFRGRLSPGFDLDAVARYVFFAELTYALEGEPAVTVGGALPPTAPTTLRAVIAADEADLRDALDDDAVVGGISGGALGNEIGGGGGGVIGGAVASDRSVEDGGGVLFGNLEPIGSDPAPDPVVVTEGDLLDQILAILVDPDPMKRPVGEDLLFGFGYDLTDVGPDILAGDFEAILETVGFADTPPGGPPVRADFSLDLAVSVAPIPLPASMPLLVAGLAGLGWAGRRGRGRR